jgi:hypothetical protein
MAWIRIAGLALVVATALTLPLQAQEAKRPLLPLSYAYSQKLKDNPGAINELGASLPPVAVEGGPVPVAPLPSLSRLKAFGEIGAITVIRRSNELRPLQGRELMQQLKGSDFAPEGTPAQLWSNLKNVPSGGPYNFGNPLLLTDGTVIVHRTSTPDWYKLTPDNSGSYVNGSWTKIASMQSKPVPYGPMYFASAVLPDGRVIAEGGEYNNGQQEWTTMGSIYDPAKNAWTAMSPPTGWKQIGDGESAVLSNGTFMLADCCDGAPFAAAVLDPSHLTWSSTGGNSKADNYDEEGWTLTPDGTLLTVDAYTTAINGTACGLNTERYDPSAGGNWSSAGNVPHQLADCNAINAEGGSNPSYEMGPQVLMYNKKVIAFGGTTANVAHTALYDTAAKKWAAGPDLPSTCGPNGNSPCTLADAPATLLPSGHVLFAAGAGLFHAPTGFFEYDPGSNKIAAVPGTVDASQIPSFYVNFLILPNGQILAVENQTSTIQVYSPSGNFQDAWRPVVDPTIPSCVVRGGNYLLTGKQLNGLSQGANYGDDQQAATNFPLIRIINKSSGHVSYARTSGFSTMTVASGAVGSTHFSVATNIETGASTLYVVANGIPSLGSPVTVAASSCQNLSANQ